MGLYLLLLFVAFSVFMSLRILFLPHKIKGKAVSFENFVMLGCIYATVTIGFGLVYFLLEMNGYEVLNDSGKTLSGPFYQKFESSFYFSAMTLFSVGYGDVVPLGIGRMIAIIEALIGYTIPAAFVARAVRDLEH